MNNERPKHGAEPSVVFRDNWESPGEVEKGERPMRVLFGTCFAKDKSLALLVQ